MAADQTVPAETSTGLDRQAAVSEYFATMRGRDPDELERLRREAWETTPGE